MISYEVGGVVSDYIGLPDCNVMELSASGLFIVEVMNAPTAAEVASVKSGKKAEFRFCVIDNLLVITFKLGSDQWQDATYSPALAADIELPEIPVGSGLGLALTLMQVDSRTGKITAIRVIGLGERFSRELLAAVSLIADKSPASLEDYMRRTRAIQARYSSKELAAISANYYRVKEN